MKKTIRIITLFIILSFIVLTGKTFAATLDTIDINVDKATVKPGENIKVTIEFGQELGAYTFDISYDNNIFEYVSVDGGTANDTKDKVKVTYHDSTGGTNPRTNMSVEFKAKEDITTSNPTEFTVTAEGMANSDASETYDDITIPIVKNVTVEPEYINYTIKLENTGDIVEGKEKKMTLSYSSPMGHYYEHARLIGEATTPKGATVKLLGIDDADLEHDIIESGWGDPQGYKIGGKDVSQVLNVRGLFSDEGDYTITLKLIDRDNSDNVIAEETFNFKVIASDVTTPPIEIPEDSIVQPTEEQTTPEVQTPIVPEENTNNLGKVPTELPKTGNNIYIPVILSIFLLIIAYAYNKKSNKN